MKDVNTIAKEHGIVLQDSLTFADGYLLVENTRGRMSSPFYVCDRDGENFKQLSRQDGLEIIDKVMEKGGE